MSRISKRKQFLQSSAKQKDRELFYRTAIYTRLSSLFREKGESQSTQIEIARQYIKEKNQAGDYIEKLFPLLGVRFISAADNFDTGEREGGSRHLEVHMKNLVHEMYARDFSKKAKLQQRILKSRTYMGVLAQTQEGSEEKVCPNSYSGKIQTLCKRNRISKNKLCDIAGMALKIQFTAR